MAERPATAAALLALARALRTVQGELLGEQGFHPGQDALLMEVWDEPGQPLTVLAQRLGVAPPTVTRMAHRLERAGMVERRRDRDDARQVRIYPTPRSRLQEAAVRRSWSVLAARIEEGMSPTDAATLTRLATRATMHLRGETEER